MDWYIRYFLSSRPHLNASYVIALVNVEQVPGDAMAFVCVLRIFLNISIML